MTTVNPILFVIKDALVASIRSNSTRGKTDLTERQLATFLTVYVTDPTDGHTVRGLASQLNVSKPAITRAIDRLEEIGIAKRAADPRDRRSVLIKRTKEGSSYLNTFNGYVEKAAKEADKLAA